MIVEIDSHFPDSVRVNATVPSDLSATAVITPSKNFNLCINFVECETEKEIVVVVMNKQNNPVDIQLQQNGQYAQYTLPSRSIVTFIYPNF